MASVTRWLKEKLRVEVNATKTKVARPNEIKYLGFGFYNDKNTCVWKPKPHIKSIKEFKKKLHDETIRSVSTSIKYKISRLNPIIRGWINYFRIGSMKMAMKELSSDMSSHLFRATNQIQIHESMIRFFSTAKKGQKIPSELKLAEHYHVSRATIREVLQKLEFEGYLIRKKGSGTYLLNPPVNEKENLLYFFDIPSMIKAKGFLPSCDPVTIIRQPAGGYYAPILEIPEQEGARMEETWARQEQNGEEEQHEQSIVDFGSTQVETSRGTVHILTIVGQVEGHQILPPTTKSTKYEHVMPLLATVEESDQVDGLLILLNTMGGDIEAGLAIAELVAVVLCTVFLRHVYHKEIAPPAGEREAA